MIDQLDEQDSSQFEISHVKLYQRYSPLQFRITNASPINIINHEFYDNEEYFPFEQQPIQKMFDIPPQSPLMKQIVIRQSNTLQKGFKVVYLNTNEMTPQPKRIINQRKYYSERNETKQLKIYDNQPQRSQKGLRNLSAKVRDIVLELRSTSYKDVAEKLIQELSQDGQLIDIDNSKDEQNIKRRVYDALNVMIASKVLRKEGKKVLADGYCKQKNKKNDKESKREDVINYKRIVEEKRKRLTQLYTKMLGLYNLVERNKQLNQNEEKIMFPILIFQQIPNQMKLVMENQRLKIKSESKLHLQADLDIVAQLEMFKINKQNIQIFPLEIIQYINTPIKEYCQQHLQNFDL